jgi:putative aldouronate transport system permease protein
MVILPKQTLKQIKRNWILYLFILPVFFYIILFNYIPIYGVQISFKDFIPAKGIIGSKWVGLKWFKTFFSSPRGIEVILNTLRISVYNLLAGFPVPIIFALLLNQIKNLGVKKLIQTVTYMPHFISMVVITGMISSFFSPNSGFINNILSFFIGENIYYLGNILVRHSVISVSPLRILYLTSLL